MSGREQRPPATREDGQVREEKDGQIAGDATVRECQRKCRVVPWPRCRCYSLFPLLRGRWTGPLVLCTESYVRAELSIFMLDMAKDAKRNSQGVAKAAVDIRPLTDYIRTCTP